MTTTVAANNNPASSSFVRAIISNHHDYIHDIAYDWYGQRMCSASSDQRIKVWDRVNGPANSIAQPQWTCTSELRAHTGTIQRVAWAHPEFGQVIASCSADRTVQIYIEEVSTTSSQASPSRRHWNKAHRFQEARECVSDVAFAPRQHGLRLAAASFDGKVRIYDASDVTKVGSWNITHDIDIGSAALSLSWNTYPFDVQSLAVSTDTTVKVFALVSGKWIQQCTLDLHNGRVNCVAWAPNIGRAYHLIATACKDGAVRIYKLTPTTNSKSLWNVECTSIMKDHDCEVWRVAWNISGTMLASSGDDGAPKFWKSNFDGGWHLVVNSVGFT